MGLSLHTIGPKEYGVNLRAAFSTPILSGLLI